MFSIFLLNQLPIAMRGIPMYTHSTGYIIHSKSDIIPISIFPANHTRANFCRLVKKSNLENLKIEIKD